MNILPIPNEAPVLSPFYVWNKMVLFFVLFVYFDEFRYKNIEFPLYFCEFFHYNEAIIGERGFLVWAN